MTLDCATALSAVAGWCVSVLVMRKGLTRCHVISWGLLRMRQFELSGLVEPVCHIARAAGDAILRIYQAHGSAGRETALLSLKADDSPLTAADLAAHQVIRDGLQRLTPEIPVVSEEDKESFVHRVRGRVFWLVDPLDGTKEFLARNGEFTVNIALISDGQPMWGVVHAPALGQTYWGGVGLGAFRQEGEQTLPIAVAGPVRPGSAYQVVASKSHLNADTQAFIEGLGATDLIQAGSSLKFCRVAEGLADVYPRLAPTCEWDTAAAQAVLEGAGGCVIDTLGKRLTYGKPEVLNPSFIAASSIATARGQSQA